MTIKRFFRWRIVAVILVLLAAIYAVFAPLNVLLARVSAQRGDQQISHALYSGAFWNAVVAVLCFVGWRLMRRQSRVYWAGGACAVAAALLIVMRVWISGLLHGRNPFPVIEAILTWLPMLYVIIFALRESRRGNAA